MSLSMKIVNQETGKIRIRRIRKVYLIKVLTTPSASFEADLFGVYKGKVSSIKPYGVCEFRKTLNVSFGSRFEISRTFTIFERGHGRG